MDGNLVFIGLGSNLGDREEMLHFAAAMLLPEISPLASSRIYETPPWGYEDQPAFLNQVIKAQTRLNPQETLRKLKEIERVMGRQPNFRYGPRMIDLDILFYNDEIIHSDDLEIPHPALAARGFVLVPLLDIAPDMVHPVENKTIRELAEQLDTKGIHVFMATDTMDQVN